MNKFIQDSWHCLSWWYIDERLMFGVLIDLSTVVVIQCNCICYVVFEKKIEYSITNLLEKTK